MLIYFRDLLHKFFFSRSKCDHSVHRVHLLIFDFHFLDSNIIVPSESGGSIKGFLSKMISVFFAHALARRSICFQNPSRILDTR